MFIGGGAGMAPMRSHIFNLFHTMHTDRKVTFWYGARALQEAPYVDEFNKIQEENPNFHWTLALDRPDPVADAAGVAYKPGFVHQVIFENYLKNHENPEDIEYYLCGPPMMIQAVTKMLYDLGVPDENVMYDNFLMDNPNKRDCLTMKPPKSFMSNFLGGTFTSKSPAAC